MASGNTTTGAAAGRPVPAPVGAVAAVGRPPEVGLVPTLAGAGMAGPQAAAAPELTPVVGVAPASMRGEGGRGAGARECRRRWRGLLAGRGGD